MHVFVYGTLTDPETVGDVLDSYVFVGSAVLHGLHAVEGDYPTLAPGGEVAGRLLRTEQIDRLDEYERTHDNLYTRISVPLETDTTADGETVAVYVGDPDRLDADADWPGDGRFSERVQQYVADSGVRVERDD
jgi:gamma-glutamylcyclotransferase (GGCT)/AIG2-like uncharacterized protein YtfP